MIGTPTSTVRFASRAVRPCSHPLAIMLSGIGKLTELMCDGEPGETNRMTPASISYVRHQFPAEIISHAVWLYHVFSPSLRDIELIMAVQKPFALEIVPGVIDQPDFVRIREKSSRFILDKRAFSPNYLIALTLSRQTHRRAHSGDHARDGYRSRSFGPPPGSVS
jgi:hypothetical protein